MYYITSPLRHTRQRFGSDVAHLWEDIDFGQELEFSELDNDLRNELQSSCPVAGLVDTVCSGKQRIGFRELSGEEQNNIFS